MHIPFLGKQDLLAEAMELLQRHAPGLYELLEQDQGRLVRLGALLQEYPSLREPQDFGFEKRNADTLLDLLCSLDPLELKLRLPTKAVLAESYMTAKIQQLKGLYLGIAQLTPPLSSPGLKRRLFGALSNTIHTYLLYQLLLDVVLNKEASRPLKRLSARHLISLWDDCVSQQSLSDFFELIRSLWDARIHIQVQYGTLLGTSELLQLLEAQCAPQVLDYFAENALEEEEEAYAFQEFLFGLSYEELLLLRHEMRKNELPVISGHEVARFLGAPEQAHKSSANPDEDPYVVYRSYKRRRLKARYRRTTNAPGPRKTAEEYLVHALLQKHLLTLPD